MGPMSKRLAFLCCALACLGLDADDDSAERAAAMKASMERHRQVVSPVFAKHCNSCHGSEEPEGELDLSSLDPNMQSTSAARWAMVLQKLETREMPPQGEPRPTGEGLVLITDWIRAEMKRSGKHLARREAYANGNLVSHQLLFDSKQTPPLDAPPRIRTVSPEIYAALSGQLAKGYDHLVGQPFFTQRTGRLQGHAALTHRRAGFGAADSQRAADDTAADGVPGREGRAEADRRSTKGVSAVCG